MARNAFTIDAPTPVMSPRNALMYPEQQPGEVTPAATYEMHRDNLADTWQAMQDPQTWREAAQQYGNALLMGSIAPGARGIRAYHGSPHSFDRFDLSKIGTGEGAQAYGHGLYFAEAEPTAMSYRDALSHGVDYQGGGYPGGSTSPAAKQVADRMAGPGVSPVDAMKQTHADFMNAAKEARAAGGNTPAGRMNLQRADQYEDLANQALQLDPGHFSYAPGHMYEVDINADPERFLHWDKPLSEQSPYVQDALSKTEYLYHADRAGMKDPTGGDLAKNIVGDSPGGSDVLREAGIPGIRYLDQGSRGAGEGTHNFVVFNPETIDIIRKYGIAGLIAGGGAAAATGQPEQ